MGCSLEPHRVAALFLFDKDASWCYIVDTPTGWGYRRSVMTAMNTEKEKALRSLKTARGQIDGIIKMIEEGRYCIDISNQMLASVAMLKRANLLILKQHMQHCVLEAAEQGKGEEKIEEMMSVLAKVLDK